MNRSIMPASLLAVVAAFALGSSKAEAVPVPATLVFSYSGTVDAITDPSNVTGLHLNDTIAGTVTFNPLSDSATPLFNPLGTVNEWTEIGQFTFGAPGSPTTVDAVHGTVDSSHTNFFILFGSGLNFEFTNAAGDSLSLDFSGFLSNTPALTSLHQMPTDSTGMAAFFQALLTDGNGEIKYLDSTIDFAINVGTYTPPATTPIPATLWLFLTTLGGIGFVGWRRRRGATPLAAA